MSPSLHKATRQSSDVVGDTFAFTLQMQCGPNWIALCPLKPVHTCMYVVLSAFDWSTRDACLNQVRIFVSWLASPLTVWTSREVGCGATEGEQGPRRPGSSAQVPGQTPRHRCTVEQTLHLPGWAPGYAVSSHSHKLAIFHQWIYKYFICIVHQQKITFKKCLRFA